MEQKELLSEALRLLGSQAAVAKLMGSNRQTYQRYFNGEREMPLSKYLELKKYLEENSEKDLSKSFEDEVGTGRKSQEFKGV